MERLPTRPETSRVTSTRPPHTAASSSALVWAKVSLRTPGPVPILASAPLSGSDRSLHSTRILVGIMSWRGATRNVIQSECVRGEAFLYDTSTEQGCKPGRNIGAEEWDAEHKTARWPIRFSVTPIFLLWKLCLWENVQILYSLPSVIPVRLPCLPSFFSFLSPCLSPSKSSLIGYIFKVRTRRLSGALPQSPLSWVSSQS